MPAVSRDKIICSGINTVWVSEHFARSSSLRTGIRFLFAALPVVLIYVSPSHRQFHKAIFSNGFWIGTVNYSKDFQLPIKNVKLISKGYKVPSGANEKMQSALFPIIQMWQELQQWLSTVKILGNQFKNKTFFYHLYFILFLHWCQKWQNKKIF